ncbi:thyroid receptor-interacting protein 11 isoform X2 [Polyodon spathula]|uniref:thyroid receptor-interacting protein 11 isoform X2 n=1 Tax=Polyodon spathula TaxID=7913 RepID=UPI001B7F64EC|nr:thyroid receptor-interacting protein 11 isoform X2 [Polyodon spathula]
MSFKDNPCRRFQANIFNKSKCQNCFKPRESHLLNDEDLNKAKPIYGGWLLLAPEGTDFDNPMHRSRKWQRRFFILYEHGLLRYALDEMPSTLPQGTINMNQCSDVIDGESRTGQRSSLCILTPDKEYFIRAENKEIINGWRETLIVYPRSNKQSQKKKRKVEPPTPQEPGPAKVAVTSSSSVPDIHAVDQVPTSKATLWQEELRGRSTIPCSRSASCLYQLSQPGGPQGAPTGTPKEDQRRVSAERTGGGRKARVESGYFSLEKIKPETRPPPPQQLPITSPTRYSCPDTDVLTPGRSPEYCDPFLSSHSPSPFSSSQSSLDSEASSSTQTSGMSWEARSQPARNMREYASLADIPKAKRISNRDAFQVEKKRLEQRTRARSPGREEVARIFGTERRRSQVIDQFETLDSEHAECMETSSSTEPYSSSSSTSRQGRSERRSYAKKQEFTLKMSKEGSVPDVSAPPISPYRRAKSLDRRTTESSMTPDLLNFKKGWMTKLYEDNQWKKHWFVLTDQSLRYYRDSVAEEAADLDGEIDLSTCHDVTEFPVQRNYGFQIHTKEGAFTLSAMTSGIRRNWIQAIMKNVRPVTAPDVTSSLPEEAKVHSACGSTSTSGEIQESEVDGGSTEQHRSRARERRREGRSKTFDWAEFRPMQQAMAQKALSPSSSDSAQISEAASQNPDNMTDLERERAQRREERRKRFESVNAAEEATRMEVDRAPASPETKPVQVEIEQRWHKVETTPLREEKQIPIATLREEKQIPIPIPIPIPIAMLHSSVPTSEPLPPQELAALLDKELGKTQRELSRLKQENHLLQEQLEGARDREHSAREGYILQTDTAASPMGSWQRLHKLNQDLQTEIESQRQRQDLTNQQVQALKRNYGEAKDVIRDHEVEIQNLQTKLNNAMDGIQISEQAIAKMRSDLQMEKEKFIEGLEDWEHNEQTLRSQLRDSENRLKDVEALLLEKSQALRDLERQQALQRDYQKEVQKLQDRLTEVTSQLVITEQAQGLKEERVQQNYEMLRESHEKEKESLALSLVEAEGKVREFEDRLQEAEQQVDSLQKEKRTTTLESSEVVHHLEEELVIKNVTIQKLTKNIRDLEEVKDQLTCRCQELINQITEADNEVAKLQSRLKTEETDYYNLEHSYEKVSEELQKIHKVISEKDEEIKQAKEMYVRLMEKKDRDLNEALIKMAALGSSLEETECKLQLKEELISKIGHSGSEAGSAVQKEGLQCKLEAAEVRITELEQLIDDMQLSYSKLQLENSKRQEDCDDHENIRKQESSTVLDQPQTTSVRPKVKMTTDTGAVLSKRQRIWFSSIHCQKYGQDDTSSTSSDTSQDRSLSEESGSSDPPHHYLPSANTDPERFILIIHSLETKLYITEEKLKDVTLKLEEQQSRQLELMMEHHSKWAKTETELREQLGESLSKVDTLTVQLRLEIDKRLTFAQETVCHIRAIRVTCEKALVCLESGREKVQSILACHKENSTDQQLHTLSEIEVELVNAAIHIGQGWNTLEEQTLKCQEALDKSRENEISDEEKIKLFAKTLAFEALVLNKMACSIQNPNLDLLWSLSEVHKEAEKLKSSDESYVAIAYTDVLTQKLMLESEFWSEMEKLQTQFKETDNSGQESKPEGPSLLEQAGKTVITNACVKAELTFAVQNLKEFYEQKIKKVEGDLLKAHKDLQQREFTLKEIVKACKTPELDRVILEVGDEFKKERNRKLADVSPPELAPYIEQIQMEEAHNLAVLMVDQHLQYETSPCRLAAVEPSSLGRDKLADELKQQAQVLQRLSQDMESTCHSQTVEIHDRLLKDRLLSHMLPGYMFTNEINNSPSLFMRDALIQAQTACVACRIKTDHEKDLKQCKDAYSNMDALCQEHAKNVNSIRERYEKALQEERHTFAQAIAILKDENQALKAETSHHLSEISLLQSRILKIEERFQHEIELKNKYELELHQVQHKLTEAEGALRKKTAESQRKLETVVRDIESMEVQHEDQVQKLEDRFHGKIQELQRIHEKEMLRLHGHYTQTIKALQLTLDKYKSEDLESSRSESCKHQKEPRPEDSTARTQTQGEKTEVDSVTVLRERIQELEAQMNVMRDELEHKNLEEDVSSLKEKYQKDFENFKATCERGFAAMEETHQKVLEDMQRQHQREVGKLQEEKERLLEEETAATIAAIEAMKNAHREELERTQRAQISGMSSDIEELRRQYQEELQSIQRELEVLSEQYSQKCLENAHLAQALEAERQALRQCQRENQDLNAHNQELNNRLAAEITRLRSSHSGDGAGSPLTQGKDVYELEVLLRVKESEIQYLKQEIHSLKDELQTALRDKKYSTDKYKDIYTELSIVKAKADCDITRLRDQLTAATEALGERSAENSTVSGYDIMKSKSNPDFLKKERSSISRQIRSMRSKSVIEQVSWDS